MGERFEKPAAGPSRGGIDLRGLKGRRTGPAVSLPAGPGRINARPRMARHAAEER